MGSAFAGVKAGLLAGILFAGSVGVFNVILLFLLRSDVLTFVTANGCGGIVSGGTTPTPDECISAVLSVYIPYISFLGLIVSLFFAAGYGIFFEFIPGRAHVVKASSVGLLLLIFLLYFGLGGLSFEPAAAVAVVVFNLVMTAMYAFVLGTLYKRYTRMVEFVSQDGSLLTIIVDGRNLTGKRRTFSHRSTHNVKAGLAELAVFKEWASSGGVSIEDTRSFETTFEVEGDGLLKGVAAKRG